MIGIILFYLLLFAGSIVIGGWLSRKREKQQERERREAEVFNSTQRSVTK